VTEPPGRKRARQRSRAEAEALAAEYEASGLSRQEFCQQCQVALKTLARYLAPRRKRSGAVLPSGFSHLIRVQVEQRKEAESELMVVLIGGRRIAVSRGFDEGLLRQLIAVLEQA
jgi:hypothetical protein